MFYGGSIFNFIGACIRWLYGTIWRTIARKSKFTFKEYIYGPNNSEDYFDQTGHQFVNKIVGAIAIVVFAWIIILLGI